MEVEDLAGESGGRCLFFEDVLEQVQARQNEGADEARGHAGAGREPRLA